MPEKVNQYLKEEIERICDIELRDYEVNGERKISIKINFKEEATQDIRDQIILALTSGVKDFEKIK